MESNLDTVALKTQLLDSIQTLGQEESLFPSSKIEIDKIIQQLEQINPNPRPLQSETLPDLLGTWQLIYASNGTVMTRKIDSIGDLFKNTIKFKKIWQNLAVDRTGKIVADNNALIELWLFGEYRISADGFWNSEPDEQTAKVTFASFSFEATKFLGQSNWSLPELSIPIWEFLRNEALWVTSYLDDDVRIGRGATGNLFVFRR
jgi:hypothetical protein